MVAILMLTAAAAAMQSGAGVGEMITLAAGADEARCTSEAGLCWSMKPTDDGKGWNLHQQSGADRAERDFALLIPKHMNVSVWDKAITIPAMENGGRARGSCCGICRKTYNVFWRARWLKLYSLDNEYGSPILGDELLSVPISASKMIRACFSERDYKRRRNACHDEYNFDATLEVSPVSAPGWPTLRYVARADGFPGGASLDRDSSTDPPLKERDLERRADPACSFTRTAVYNPLTARYEFNSPSPDCSDYWDL